MWQEETSTDPKSLPRSNLARKALDPPFLLLLKEKSLGAALAAKKASPMLRPKLAAVSWPGKFKGLRVGSSRPLKAGNSLASFSVPRAVSLQVKCKASTQGRWRAELQ
jgi:hypothetical protein